MARMARYALEFCAIESCGKCTPCRIGSTRGVETMDRSLPRVAARSATITRVSRRCRLLEELCETLAAGCLCGLGGMTPFPVRSATPPFSRGFSGDIERSRPELKCGRNGVGRGKR
jgi:formate dehydrogenase iron-sulfur subunit